MATKNGIYWGISPRQVTASAFLGYYILLCLPFTEPLGTYCFPGTGLDQG